MYSMLRVHSRRLLVASSSTSLRMAPSATPRLTHHCVLQAPKSAAFTRTWPQLITGNPYMFSTGDRMMVRLAYGRALFPQEHLLLTRQCSRRQPRDSMVWDASLLTVSGSNQLGVTLGRGSIREKLCFLSDNTMPRA